VEARRAGDVVAVEDGQGGLIEFGGARDQFFGNGGAFEKAEGGAGVQLDKNRGQYTLSPIIPLA
jgi:hypothetical protein